ncbi:intermediate cleaving peptidase 55, mitochondrial-like [Neltuma alba]|uniref:intermediate cleaving peptidase 55, mitochondrial-like n=1 Tax=Neltuma alba TaxID=207710 RepID=UPI0010A45DCA|nr:intermediate cleaving peptidase 55, mitochondrial-like [Prosopis alba]
MCTTNNLQSAQEELYEFIWETNEHCAELCKPGASIRQIHNHSVEMLQKGLKGIGILRGVPSSAYHSLNPTSIGHYLGMDMHDCSRISYPLKPGVVITIEPGLHIPFHFDGAERNLLNSENLLKLQIKLSRIGTVLYLLL